ncbi:MAG: ATP-binding protein [Bacteroidota bacterium]
MDKPQGLKRILPGVLLSFITPLAIFFNHLFEIGLPSLVLILPALAGVGFLVYQYIQLHHQNVTLQQDLEATSTRYKRVIKVGRVYEAKWKKSLFKINDLKKSNESLQTEINEAQALQKEMKGFIDTQIETNEQLMIAESKLKSLLEKEQESKAILNQTLDKLKDTQGQLVHSEKMASLGQLTAGIAHEINNPINFVFNGIDSMRRNLEDLSIILDKYELLDTQNSKDALIAEIKAAKTEIEYDELRKDLDSLVDDIKEGAVRTIEIVKGLRVFSRLDEEDMKEANINECLDATLVLLKNKTKNRITVNKSYDAELPEILCYPGQLNQVFMNIINNAIQAIPEERENAEISVATTVTDFGISISLKDNGTGMSEEVRKRIFEPFFTTKPVGVGTGLGMSISYGIIEKHQGKLRVESEYGVGTEFIIDLPKAIDTVLSEAS